MFTTFVVISRKQGYKAGVLHVYVVRSPPKSHIATSELGLFHCLNFKLSDKGLLIQICINI